MTLGDDNESLFQDNEVLGTPDYIPPEVIMCQAYGFGVDWWSLGVVLYEMLIGITPFTAPTVDEVFSQIIDGKKNLEFRVALAFACKINYATMKFLWFSVDDHEVSWPDSEEDDIPLDAKDVIHSLLWMDPNYRLGAIGAGGVATIKNHPFFYSNDEEPQFIPSLEGEEDTSYFDCMLSSFYAI